MEESFAVNKPSTKLAIFAITERDGADRSFWTRIGAAFKNRDGSYNIHLDALPTNGKLHMREDQKRERREGEEVRS